MQRTERKKVSQKKPRAKTNAFDPDLQIGNWIEARLNKINSLEYVELDYFTIR